MRFKLLSIFTIVTLTIQAQNNLELSYYLPQNTTYKSEIPTPESSLGYQVGEWHATHDKLVAYMKQLSEVSPRITFEDRGKTFEGRPLILLTITDPKNHENLENIEILKIRKS